ncbi:hypothetical protein A2U01_0009500, partial [Trifolium medium]|nr:hypothetical protein [Trifolium medium]
GDPLLDSIRRGHLIALPSTSGSGGENQGTSDEKQKDVSNPCGGGPSGGR